MAFLLDKVEAHGHDLRPIYTQLVNRCDQHEGHINIRGIPFYRQQILYVCSAFTVLNLLLAAWVIYEHGFQWRTAIFPFLSVLCRVRLGSTGNARWSFWKMETLLIDSRKGLHLRITNTAGLGEVSRVAWELNELLDIIETYFKEVNTCFTRVSEGVFYRRPYRPACPANSRIRSSA